jgi:hypothetical protein
MVKGAVTLLATGLSSVPFAVPSAAQASKDYAIIARATWSAFECSSVASHIQDTTQAKRLFALHGKIQK